MSFLKDLFIAAHPTARTSVSAAAVSRPLQSDPNIFNVKY